MSVSFTALIREQSYECLIMFGSGIMFMIGWQICTAIWRQGRVRRWIRTTLEIIFWLAAAAIVSEFLFYGAYGKISAHAIVSFLAGLLLWKHCFYGIITLYGEKWLKNSRKRNGKEEKKQSI